MNRLFLSASALAVIAVSAISAHAQEPILGTGKYIFGGPSSLLSESTRNATSDSGFMVGVGMAGHTSARRVGVPAWELTHFRNEGNGNTLSATGISYIERDRARNNSRNFYGFGLGVYDLRLAVSGSTTGGEVAFASSRATSLGTKDGSGIRVVPTFLLGFPLSTKTFLEVRYTGLGSLSGVRADQYNATFGLRF
jgi:hypothetical protein